MTIIATAFAIATILNISATLANLSRQKMKRLVATVIAIMLASVSLGSVTGEVCSFSRNLRADGFGADFVVAGMLVEDGRPPPDRSRHYVLRLKVSCDGNLTDIRVAVHQGERGKPSWFQAELLSASPLIGEVALPTIEVGTKDYQATLSVSATRRDNGRVTHIFECSTTLLALIESRTNQ